jgi:hypothetical protein
VKGWRRHCTLSKSDINKQQYVRSPDTTHRMTCQTLQSISKLTLEVIDNETVITALPSTPFLLAGYLLGETFHFGFLLRCTRPRRLHHYSIQILMKSIQKKTKEFLGVMLVRSIVLRFEITNCFLEVYS